MTFVYLFINSLLFLFVCLFVCFYELSFLSLSLLLFTTHRGMLVGADITDYVIILNTIDALRAFSGVGQLSIGADIDVALGPIGRFVQSSSISLFLAHCIDE